MRCDRIHGRVQLSPREIQLVYMLCTEALPTKEMAARLGIAEPTVRRYLDDLLRELRLYSRPKLIIWGAQHPEALKGEWVTPEFHPPGCACGQNLCAVLAPACPVPA